MHTHHSNNGAMIVVYTASCTIYIHGPVVVLPVLRLPKSASNHKLTLLTIILHIISHFGLHRQTPVQLRNQSMQSKIADNWYKTVELKSGMFSSSFLNQPSAVTLEVTVAQLKQPSYVCKYPMYSPFVLSSKQNYSLYWASWLFQRSLVNVLPWCMHVILEHVAAHTMTQ